MAQVLFIIAQHDFRDEELLEPKQVLENAGHTCHVASTSTEPAYGMLGVIVDPDVAFDEVDIKAYRAVVVVGGRGSPALAQNENVISVLQQANEQGKLIASICLGGVVLAKARVLTGKKATVFKTPDSVKILKENGVNFVDLPLVTDSGLVTAQGPQQAKEFGKKLVEMLR
ncbi:DJ-1/PfpI family protein [Candidatus Woesearchaeota archaeon]|nr:DJ-1/PfpI family protein [Candidatus Woesearchaeota archaeon]